MSGSIIDISDDESESDVEGFHVMFTWDYPDNWCLKDVKDTVFHVLDHRNVPRSESQFISSCIQSSGTGVIFNQPNPELDSTPCELQLAQHKNKCHITKLLVVSEGKHVELYLNHIYAKTSKGCLVSAKKGKKAALYENEFDLTTQTKGIDNIKIKFSSFAESYSMRLQTIIIWVVPVSSLERQMVSDGLSLGSIHDMVKSIGLLVSEMDSDKEFNEMSYAERQGHISDKQNHIEVLQNLMKLTGIKYSPTENTYHPKEQSTQSALSYAMAHSKPGDFYQSDTDSTMFKPKSNTSTLERSSKRNQNISDDRYNGYGTPNPDNESVLANAILNEEDSKHIAQSRSSAIEEQNFAHAQVELINNLVNTSSNIRRSSSTHISEVKSPPEKPPRRLITTNKKQRPHSLNALPASASEVDFTQLLSNLMHEESTESLHEKHLEEKNVDVRWQAYLKSRVRASQRMSGHKPRPLSSVSLPNKDTTYDTEYVEQHVYLNKNNNVVQRGSQQWNHVNKYKEQTSAGLSRSSSINYGSTKDFPISRSEEKPCINCTTLLNTINLNIRASEDRIKFYIDQKLHEMKEYYEKPSPQVWQHIPQSHNHPSQQRHHEPINRYNEMRHHNHGVINSDEQYVQMDHHVYRNTSSSVV